MEAPHARVTPTRQTKRKREEADTGSPEVKRPKISEESDMEIIRATKKEDDWCETHQKLYDHLKDRRAKMAENTSIDKKIATPSETLTHSSAVIQKPGRSPQECLEVVLCRLEAVLERHYCLHLESTSKGMQASITSTKSSNTKSSLNNDYTLRIKSIESILELNRVKVDDSLPTKQPRTRQVARKSLGPRNNGSNSSWPTFNARSLASKPKLNSEPKPEPKPEP